MTLGKDYSDARRLQPDGIVLDPGIGSAVAAEADNDQRRLFALSDPRTAPAPEDHPDRDFGTGSLTFGGWWRDR